MDTNRSSIRRKGIRARLITAIVGIGILPFLVAGVYLSWQNYVVQKKQIAEQQSALTRLASQRISAFFHEQRHLAAAYVLANFRVGIEQDNIAVKLRRFLAVSWDDRHNYIFNAAYVIDENGTELSHASRVKVTTVAGLRDLSEADEFTTPFYKNTDYFSSVYFDKRLGGPLMKMALPIVDKKTTQPIGIFVAEMKFKPIWNVVAELSIGHYRVAYVVDHDGTILAHKNPSIVLRNLRLPLWNRTGVITKPFDRQVIQTVERIQYDGPPLYMVIEVPMEKAYRHLYEELRTVILFFAIALIGAIAVGFIVMRRIILPIEGLSATALAIAQGDYGKKAKYTNNDELGDLASAFNAMTDNLVGAIRRVEYEKEFMQSAIDALTHPFIVIDVKDHGVVLQNAVAQVYRAEDTKSCYTLLHRLNVPCNGRGLRCPIDKVIDEKGPVTIEHVSGIESGNARYYEVNAYPIFDNKGDVVQVIEYIIDITEKKALEAQLRQAKKLEALGNLAGGVAHDFNNLLTGIIGYAELTLKKLAVDSPLRSGVEIILESGERGADLTSQLLTFSRKQALEFEVINLSEILDGYSKIIKGIIGDNIKLDISVDSHLWNIKADAGQINQLLINLSVNASDAMQGGGFLTIKATNERLNDETVRNYHGLSTGRYIKVVVADTGTGISSDIKERLLEPFFTTKGQYGTGLGLAIVYGVVKQHGGAINIESEVGVGTQVTLLFPVTDEPAENKGAAESLPVLKGNEVVLVVDDDICVLRLIKDVLQAHGYTVHTASSGGEALNVCNKLDGQIDLLLTDVAMPEMNGRELVDAVNQHYATVKSMFMSGNQDDALAQAKIIGEQDALIRKPVRVGALLSSVRSVLDAVVS